MKLQSRLCQAPLVQASPVLNLFSVVTFSKSVILSSRMIYGVRALFVAVGATTTVAVPVALVGPPHVCSARDTGSDDLWADKRNILCSLFKDR
jgi:hypothetical protein